MTGHKVGTRDEWLVAREALLAREKEHTRLGDELARQRRELPWVPVEKDYRFDTAEGEKALAELFDGRSQLLVYHFMFGPSYEAGCPVNSSIADTIDGVLPHLHARDVTFLLVSQAPLDKLQAYRRRMGWQLPWASTERSDFNFDLGFSHTEEEGRQVVAQMTGAGLPPIVEHNARSSGTDVAGYLTESPGFSSFVLDGGAVYHTYSTTWRGLEFLMGYYPILDHAPKGRDEGEDWQLWIRRHDEYRPVGVRCLGATRQERAGVLTENLPGSHMPGLCVLDVPGIREPGDELADEVGRIRECRGHRMRPASGSGSRPGGRSSRGRRRSRRRSRGRAGPNSDRRRTARPARARRSPRAETWAGPTARRAPSPVATGRRGSD